MTTEALHERLAKLAVIPVISIEDVKDVLPLADALAEGGLPVAEITFRTKVAAEAMLLLKRKRPDMLLGAGTVLTPENLNLARDCGAAFAVSPGFNPDVVRAAQEKTFPFFPGVATPTDIENALSCGLKILKFFPADMMGGPAMVKALSGPYAHTGIKFIPTGGVTQENFAAYLSLKTVLAVGGSWIAKKDIIAAGRWEIIRETCRDAGKVVARIEKT